MGPNVRVLPRPHYGHTTMVFGFFLALCTLVLQGIATPKIIAFGTSEIATLSNQYRSNAGLSTLTTDPLLSGSAQAKADHMATNMYFAHDAPDGTTPWAFFAAQGYSYYSAGENLALSNQSASSVVDGWYNSTGHRANMMSTDFTEVGYGISFVSSFTYNSTQYNNVYLVAAHYAKPTNPTPPPAPQSTPQQTATVPNTVTEEFIAEIDTVEVPAETPPVEVEVPTPVPETASAPTGFSEEPDNTTRSGEYTSLANKPTEVSPPLTVAGIGTGGAFVLIGSTMEIRRLLRHQSFLPRFHKK